MRIVLQRVSEAAVRVDGDLVGSIGDGLCLLVGLAPADSGEDVAAAVDKVASLRIFGDKEGKMNRSLIDVGGEVLVVSQFTLVANVRKGRRPSFTGAAAPDVAEPLIDGMVEGFKARGVTTAHGVFGAHMEVSLTNDGPVTLILDVTDGVVH